MPTSLCFPGNSAAHQLEPVSLALILAMLVPFFFVCTIERVSFDKSPAGLLLKDLSCDFNISMRSHGHQQTIPTLTWAAEVMVLIPASFLESFCLRPTLLQHSHACQFRPRRRGSPEPKRHS